MPQILTDLLIDVVQGDDFAELGAEVCQTVEVEYSFRRHRHAPSCLALLQAVHGFTELNLYD